MNPSFDWIAAFFDTITSFSKALHQPVWHKTSLNKYSKTYILLIEWLLSSLLYLKNKVSVMARFYNGGFKLTLGSTELIFLFSQTISFTSIIWKTLLRNTPIQKIHKCGSFMLLLSEKSTHPVSSKLQVYQQKTFIERMFLNRHFFNDLMNKMVPLECNGSAVRLNWWTESRGCL